MLIALADETTSQTKHDTHQFHDNEGPPKSVNWALVMIIEGLASTTDALMPADRHDGQSCRARMMTDCTFTGCKKEMVSHAWSVPELENAVPRLPSLIADSRCVVGHKVAAVEVGTLL